MLHEHATTEERLQCINESKQLLLDPPTHFQLEDSCPILNRLCLETLRLTAHSIGGLRIACKDFPLDNNNDSNLVIPNESTIALAHIPSSLDGKIWENPTSLNLDITSSSRSKELYGDDYVFTAFSHGTHKCPGQRMALTMMTCTVAILLIEWNIEFLDGVDAIPPLCFERATLAQRKGQVLVRMSERKLDGD